MKHPRELVCLNTWTLNGGAVLESFGTLGVWSLTGDFESLGSCIESHRPAVPCMVSASVPLGYKLRSLDSSVNINLSSSHFLLMFGHCHAGSN